MHYRLYIISLLYTVHSDPENLKNETIPRHSAWIGLSTNVTLKHASKAITYGHLILKPAFSTIHASYIT